MSGKKLFLVILLGIFTLGMIGGGTAFFVISSQSTAKEIKLGNDILPTFYVATEKKGLTGISKKISSGIETLEYSYNVSVVNQEDLDKYAEYLVENNGFRLSSEYKEEGSVVTYQIAAASKDTGKIILIDFQSDIDKKVIIIRKGEGELTEK